MIRLRFIELLALIVAIPIQASEPPFVAVRLSTLIRDLEVLEPNSVKLFTALKATEPHQERTLEYLIVSNPTAVGSDQLSPRCPAIAPASPSIAALVSSTGDLYAPLVPGFVDDADGEVQAVLARILPKLSDDAAEDALVLSPTDLHALNNLLYLNRGLNYMSEKPVDGVGPFLDLINREPLHRWIFNGEASSHALVLSGLRSSTLMTVLALPCDSSGTLEILFVAPEQRWVQDAVQALWGERIPISLLFEVREHASQAAAQDLLSLLEAYAVSGSRTSAIRLEDGLFDGSHFLLIGTGPRSLLDAPSLELVSRDSSLLFFDRTRGEFRARFSLELHQDARLPILALGPWQDVQAIMLFQHYIYVRRFPSLLASQLAGMTDPVALRERLEKLPRRLRNKLEHQAGATLSLVIQESTELVASLQKIVDVVTVGFQDKTSAQITITLPATVKGVPLDRINSHALGEFIATFVDNNLPDSAEWTIAYNLRIHPDLSTEGAALVEINVADVNAVESEDSRERVP